MPRGWKQEKCVFPCVCVVSKCAVIHPPPHLWTQTRTSSCSLAFTHVHVHTLKRALFALLFYLSVFFLRRASNQQEEASAAVVRSRASHQVSVPAVKPRGQVLGSTLAQKSGRPAAPRGRRSVHNKPREAGRQHCREPRRSALL